MASGPDHRDVVLARVIVGAAVVGAAWVVLRSPPARRLLWRGVKFAAATWLPAFVAGQVREAWAASAPVAAPEAAGVPPPAPAPAVAAFAPPAGGPQ